MTVSLFVIVGAGLLCLVMLAALIVAIILIIQNRHEP